MRVYNKTLDMNVEYFEENNTKLWEMADQIVRNDLRAHNRAIVWKFVDESPNSLLQRWVTEDNDYTLLLGINENKGKFGVHTNKGKYGIGKN